MNLIAQTGGGYFSLTRKDDLGAAFARLALELRHQYLVGFVPNDLDDKVRKGLDRLYAYQHDDGGWGWWKDDKSDPFMTAYVVDGLTMASRAGYQVDNWRQAQGRENTRPAHG